LRPGLYSSAALRLRLGRDWRLCRGPGKAGSSRLKAARN